jgi:predicted RNA-binding Zn-ribbon protein involved in translation (DUF1610 family)
MEKRYECYHCQHCPTVEEWNNHSHSSDCLLPEGEDGGVFDCPECGQVVCGEDINPV